jgi:hypothetical protein
MPAYLIFVKSADGPIKPVYFQRILLGHLMQLLRHHEQPHPHLGQDRLAGQGKTLSGSFAQLFSPVRRPDAPLSRKTHCSFDGFPKMQRESKSPGRTSGPGLYQVMRKALPPLSQR